MGNHSIEDKLRAIEEAQVLFHEAFRPGMSDSQWAYSAMVVEQQYNYIREILQVKQIRIKADLGAGSSTATVKPPKEKKVAAAAKPKAKAYATMDMSKLAESFAKFQALQPKKEEKEGNGTPNLIKTSDPNPT
jgi:hypothetical protein